MEGTGNKVGYRVVVLVVRALLKIDFGIRRTWQPRLQGLQIERAERSFHEIYVLGKRFRCYARRRQGQRWQRQQVRRLETQREWLLESRSHSRFLLGCQRQLPALLEVISSPSGKENSGVAGIPCRLSS